MGRDGRLEVGGGGNGKKSMGGMRIRAWQYRSSPSPNKNSNLLFISTISISTIQPHLPSLGMKYLKKIANRM
jgi:hypothetical protein